MSPPLLLVYGIAALKLAVIWFVPDIIVSSVSKAVHAVTRAVMEDGIDLIKAIDTSPWSVHDALMKGCIVDGNGKGPVPLVHLFMCKASEIETMFQDILSFRPSMNIVCPVYGLTPLSAALKSTTNGTILAKLILSGAKPSKEDFKKLSVIPDINLIEAIVSKCGGEELFASAIETDSSQTITHMIEIGLLKCGVGELLYIRGENIFGLPNIPLTYAISCGSVAVVALFLKCAFTYDHSITKSEKLTESMKNILRYHSNHKV